VGLGGGRKLEADRHSQYQVALEAVGIGIAPAQRVANEPHALREPRVLERPSQFARQEVGDLVLEAFASAVGEWEVVRLLADAQHPVAAYRLALLRRCAERQQQSRRYDECPAPRAPRSARVEADKVFGGLSGHLVRAGSPRAPCVFARSIPLTLRKVAAVKFASARLAPVKSVSMKFEPLKSAPARLAPRMSVPLNSAPLSLAPARLAPERSVENIIAPCRLALVRFVPSAKLTVRLHRERLELARLLRFRTAAARFAPLKSMLDRSSPERFLE